MAAPKGNRFWEARSSHGRNPKFATAEDLRSACIEYFEWNADNPLQAAELVKFQGEAKVAYSPRIRAMTVNALCLFLGINHDTWRNYRERGQDFLDVITQVEDVIRSQKFEGAAADLLNANIIARDLGLADKSEFTGKDGGPIETNDTSSRALALALAALVADGQQEDPDG